MRVAAALLVLSLCSACKVPGYTLYEAARPFDPHLPDTFALVCWNAQKGWDPGLILDLRNAMDTYETHLVFLQEAHAELLPNSRMGGVFAPSWSYPFKPRDIIGVATLSTAEPIGVEKLVSRHREFGITAPKTSVATYHRLPNGATLLAVNVHVLAFERCALKGVKAQIEDLTAVMARHEGPILLAGDFNIWNAGRLEAVEAMAKKLDLTEVVEFPWGRTTADKGSKFWNGLLGIDPMLILDRVYFRGLELIRAEVLPDETSDHIAMLVEMRVTGN